MEFDPNRFYTIDEDRKPQINSYGFVADSYRILKTMVEAENMQCYGQITKLQKHTYPYGFEINHTGLFWNCFYEIQLN